LKSWNRPAGRLRNRVMELRKVAFAYETSKPVLREISLRLGRSQAVHVGGRNGSGKTTLSLLAAGFLKPDSGGILLDGREVRGGRRDGELRRRVGLLHEDFPSQLVCPTVEDELAFGLENLGLSPDVISDRVEQSLSALRLREKRKLNPGFLSGGEKQRLALACVISMGFDVLILDEPERNLDRIQKLELAEQLDSIAAGGTAILHLGSRRLGGEAGAAGGFELLEGILERFRDESPGEGAEDAHPPRTGRGVSAGEELLAAAFGRFSFPGSSEPVLGRVELGVRRGEVVLLEGRNGSGKSTLLRILAGILEPEGCTRKRTAPGGRDCRVSMLFQFPERQFFKRSVREEISFSLADSSGGPAERLDPAGILALVGLPREKLDASPFSLSRAEKRLLALACVIAGGAEILLLDEPLSGLDHGSSVSVMEAVAALAAQGKGIVLASADPILELRYSSRVARLEGGRIR